MTDAGDDERDEGPDRPPRDDSPDAKPRGVDLARQALQAARARNDAARTARGRRTGAGAGGRSALRLRRRRWSGAGPDRARDPQRLGDTAAAWIARADTGGEVVKARLFARWAEIVGPAVADHCEPISLLDGDLALQAESTAWATQLRLMAPTVIKQINAELGRGTVRRIRTTGPSGPSWRFGDRHVRGRGPRDTYG